MAAKVTELLPLDGYKSSVAVDANDSQVVGFSMHPNAPSSPKMHATLWQDGKPKELLPLSGASSPSVGFRINSGGAALIAEGVTAKFLHGGFQWSPADTYRLWRAGQPLLNLADTGASAVDLNDDGQILIRNADESAAIMDLSTNKTTNLPDPPADGVFSATTFLGANYLGIDRVGRVAFSLMQLDVFVTFDWASKVWWLEAAGTDWVKLDPPGSGVAWWEYLRNLSYPPRLTRGGLLVATRGHEHVANEEFWDLDDASKSPQTVPVAPGGKDKTYVFRNSSPNGLRVVGFEAQHYAVNHPFLWGNCVATYYDRGEPTATSLAGDLPDKYDSSIAVAATDGGLIVGNGTIGQVVRGWILEFVRAFLDLEPPPIEWPPKLRRWPWPDPVYELILALTVPDVLPRQIFLARARDLIQAMTPQERKITLDRLAHSTEQAELLIQTLKQAMSD